MHAPAYPWRTARLDLRPYTVDDLDFLHAMQGDEASTRYLYYGQQSREESRNSLERKVSRCVLRGEGDALQMVAVDLATGVPVGEATLAWTSEVHRSGEIGYLLHPARTGHGFATEMGAEMLRVGFTDLGLHRMVGRIDPRNSASAAVLTRLGMRQEAHLVENEWVKGEWVSEGVYAILAAEWSAARVAVDDDGATQAPSA